MPTKHNRTRRIPADNLVRAGNKGDNELTEDELNRVTGGATDQLQLDYTKIKFEPAKA